MTDADMYRIAVQRRETEDGMLYEATVKELPDVSVYAETFQEAYELACDAIESLKELAEDQGRVFPNPSTIDNEYSGKFVVRLTKSLHRDLALAATEQGVSLNQYVVSLLSVNFGFRTATEAASTLVSITQPELPRTEVIAIHDEMLPGELEGWSLRHTGVASGDLVVSGRRPGCAEASDDDWLVISGKTTLWHELNPRQKRVRDAKKVS